MVSYAQDLVNTHNVVREIEKLPDEASLARFLSEHGISAERPVSPGELAAARRLRSTLRPVFGALGESETVAVLNAILVEHDTVPRYVRSEAGHWHLQVAARTGSPVDEFAGTAAMQLLAVVAEDGLDRLRTCVGNRCQEVFVDASRNRSRMYCSPAICGNRAHAAARRRRARGSG